MSELVKSYPRKDFDIQWFSGTGKGGQNRNKHQNCCRITHIPTGLRAVGQTERDRPANQKRAFQALAAMLLELDEKKKPRNFSNEVVRTYHFERGEVIDNSTGLRRSIEYVMNGGLSDFIENPDRNNVRPSSGRA